jgi:mediator of RNA polymerase II transcription subunit 12, fungi type
VEHAEPIPDLSELLDLPNDDDPNAPSAYANRFWIKYRTSLDWASKVWDNTVTSLRYIPEKVFDAEIRLNHALRYGAFLWKVDQHLPNGLDGDILQWLLGPGRVVVASLNADAWEVLGVVLIYLVVHGALKTTTILRGLIYPAWQMGAGSANQPLISETHLSAANGLCSRLLLGREESNEMPPTELFEAQSIRTRRQEVYDEPHFSLLVSSIPTLISLEINEELPESLRLESTSLRCQLCQESGFRQGAYRNLDVIREAFESSPYLIDEDPTSENLSKRAIAGLRMILCDSTDGACCIYFTTHFL